MAYSLFSDYTENYVPKDEMINIVYDIVSLVKEKNYSSALDSLKKHHISFYNLVSRTQRLKLNDLVKFADYAISHSRNE